MSIYYTVACRTCKKKLDLAGYANPTLDENIGFFARWTHGGHDVVVINDMSGWDEEYDRLISEIDDFETEISE